MIILTSDLLSREAQSMGGSKHKTSLASVKSQWKVKTLAKLIYFVVDNANNNSTLKTESVNSDF